MLAGPVSAWTKATIFVALYFAGVLSGLVASLVLRRTATKGRSLPLVLSNVPSALLFFDAAIAPDGAETLESTVVTG